MSVNFRVLHLGVRWKITTALSLCTVIPYGFPFTGPYDFYMYRDSLLIFLYRTLFQVFSTGRTGRWAWTKRRSKSN